LVELDDLATHVRGYLAEFITLLRREHTGPLELSSACIENWK